MSETASPMSLPTATNTDVIVCTTCRLAGASRELPADGELLFEAVQVAQLEDDTGAWAQVRVRGVACLSSCGRACSVAFQAPGKHTFVFGDLKPDEETARHVLECGAMHARASDGMLNRNERPARLKSGIVARLPPFAPNPTG